MDAGAAGAVGVDEGEVVDGAEVVEGVRDLETMKLYKGFCTI